MVTPVVRNTGNKKSQYCRNQIFFLFCLYRLKEPDLYPHNRGPDLGFPKSYRFGTVLPLFAVFFPLLFLAFAKNLALFIPEGRRRFTLCHRKSEIGSLLCWSITDTEILGSKLLRLPSPVSPFCYRCSKIIFFCLLPTLVFSACYCIFLFLLFYFSHPSGYLFASAHLLPALLPDNIFLRCFLLA